MQIEWIKEFPGSITICDKEGISIKNNITIRPFELKESGEISGKVHTSKINETFDLFYTRYGNYSIVWTKKELGQYE